MVPWEPLPGDRYFSVDGSELAKTDKRLGVLHDVKCVRQESGQWSVIYSGGE